MEKRRRVPGRSAPYGQACLSCFKSKCKCIVRSDGGEGCERCHRLNKSCHSGDSLRQRTTNKAQRANARVAELEGKLEGLVSLLQERKVIDECATPSPRRRSLPGQPDCRPSEIDDDRDDVQLETEDTDFCDAGDDGVDELQRPATGSPLPQGGRAASLTLHAEGPTTDLEANQFDGFRLQQLPNLPFIHFSADVTAIQLQVERPMLHRAIVCVTSSSAREKQARAIELKRLLSDAAISQPPIDKVTTDNRMDLLLAILVFISWSWDHVLTRTSPSRLMMLAMSLAGEISLTRTLSSRKPNIFDPKAVDRNINPLRKMTVDHLLELQRALLGCFVLSSAVAAHFGEIDPLRWTPELDEALASIEAHKQCPEDATLAAQARLQLLAVDAVQARDQNHAHQIRAAVSMDPAMLQVKGMLLQLQDIRNAMSPMTLPKYRKIQRISTNFTD
ncbi:hypothetical protein CTRI78_v006143 [Colletotrichum trifolii]|uniref:Zn(2)-C6 fungal-type domain-containing protein n=1 Tax=Colletotrichum trifolii TaxID=5466 RepID=A0A4R8RJS8_COLTR|nr:hypothetical protein CTRI78_v006143 [Colletotrichum trifolii]